MRNQLSFFVWVHAASELLLRAPSAEAFIVTLPSRLLASSRQVKRSSHHNAVEFESLMDMDVVVYSRKHESKKYLGAVQENGTVSPLSVWSEEPVFGVSLEFVVDEEDRFPGLSSEDVTIHSLVPQNMLSYGSRQVGGGKGPGNPHGEESELLYYVEQDFLKDIELVLKPELEILW